MDGLGKHLVYLCIMARLRIKLVNIAFVSGACLSVSGYVIASDASICSSFIILKEHCLLNTDRIAPHDAAISISSIFGRTDPDNPSPLTDTQPNQTNPNTPTSPLPLLLLPLPTSLLPLPLLLLRRHHRRRNPTPLLPSTSTTTRSIGHDLVSSTSSSDIRRIDSHTSHPPSKLPQHLHQPSYLGGLGGLVLEGYAAGGVEGFED